MAFIPNLNAFLIFTIVIVLLPTEIHAFGAGDIPDFAYLNDKAFRHGDIENILETLVKNAGGLATGGGLLSFAHSMIQQAAGGAKFTRSDIKKVYFGNWLRDYSQAMDIAGLNKLTADTLVLVVSVLGFMTFGFATEEFQVTADRLGVYLPVEHIDNPKGYAAQEGDARQVHPKLRPPVDDRELEFDERTGMKNYMATEDQGWDSSTAFIKRTFRACIEAGRRAGGNEGAELWEAYRLLGTGLHTMEDLLAHSNWCEVGLRKLGHNEVFCHVGENVVINTPTGPAPPLITGTFGGADFIHSLMGEATDKLSQASVTDLSQRMSQASGGDQDIQNLKDILSKLPIGGDDKLNQSEEIHAQAKAYSFDPDNVAPPEVQQQLLDLLKWRDGVYREVVAKIEMVPGLSELLDELTNALNAYVYTVISPYIVPILQQATGVLGEGSKAVIDSEDQYEVFNNPDASDPSHSFLSKDHFNLILNEPAGKIAQIVVQHSVNLIVQAWADDSDPDQVISQILEAFHHPYYATGQSNIQQQMFDHLDRWIGGLGHEETREIIERLTKDSVRNGRNKRPGSENESQEEAGYGGHSHGGAAYRPAGSGGARPSQQGQSGYGGNQYGSNNQYGSSGQYDTGNQYGSGNQHQSVNQYSASNQYNSSNQHGSDNQYGSNNRGSAQEQGRYDTRPTRNVESFERDTYGESDTQRHHQGSDGYGSRRSEGNEYTAGPGSQGRAYGSEDRSNRTRYEGEQRGSGHGAEEDYGTRHTGNEASYGSSRGYGQDVSQNYGSSQGGRYGEGRHEGHRSEHQESEHRRRKDDDSDEEQRRSHDHSSRGESGGYAPSYAQPSSTQQSYGGGESGYGGGRSEERPYGGSGYNRGGDDYGERSYGRGDRDETFGAERLRVDSDDDDDKRRRHHRKRDSD